MQNNKNTKELNIILQSIILGEDLAKYTKDNINKTIKEALINNYIDPEEILYTSLSINNYQIIELFLKNGYVFEQGFIEDDIEVNAAKFGKIEFFNLLLKYNQKLNVNCYYELEEGRLTLLDIVKNRDNLFVDEKYKKLHELLLNIDTIQKYEKLNSKINNNNIPKQKRKI